MGAFDGELTALGIHPNSNETTTKPPLYMWWQGGDIVEVYEKHPYTGRARIKTVYGMRYEVHVDHLEPITDEILVAVNAKLMGILEKHSKFNPYTVHALAAKRIRDLEQRLAAANAEIARMKGSSKGTETYGCHCDLEPEQKPDGCVIDEDRPNDCDHAINLVREGSTKLDCRYWQVIQTDKL